MTKKSKISWEQWDREVFSQLTPEQILDYLERNLTSCTFFRGGQGYNLRKGTDDLRAAVAQEMWDERH